MRDPLASLKQSVDNMAQGDMDNTIWGIERSDIVGDMARSIEKSASSLQPDSGYGGRYRRRACQISL